MGSRTTTGRAATWPIRRVSAAAPWFAVLLAFCLVSGFGIAQAQDAPIPEASAARLAGDSERTRFVADLSHPVGFSVYVLPDPFRVIIDLPEVNFQFPPGLGTVGRGLVSAYRYGLFDKGKSRIVLDAVGPVLIHKSFLVDAKGDQPARLVVDLVNTDRQTFFKIHQMIEKTEEDAVVAQRTPPRPQEKPQRSAAVEVQDPPRQPETDVGKQQAALMIPPLGKEAKQPKRMFTVVIDAGHGGVDPGAVGRGGTPEKDIVLKFSLELRDKLSADPRYRVILTRDSDTFLRLADRVEIARRHAADLFISVHADSIRQANVRGATVYTLSERASDREAADLASRENKADIIAGVDLAGESDEVTGILIDLAQRETKNHAVRFAKALIDKLGNVTQMNKHPHRFAGFRVLKALDVPSVLLELGYISSRKDEELLRSPAWRSKLADAVVQAMNGYFGVQVAGSGVQGSP